jgi:hypothetical protein
MWKSMATAATFCALLFAATTGAAQTMDAPPPPPPAPMPPPPPPESTPTPAGTAPFAGAAASDAPATSGAASEIERHGGDLTGAPDPTALTPNKGDELRFSSHGYFRAPMRIGIGSRPGCPAGAMPGTLVGPNGNLNPTGTSVPCASAGQSTINLHSPMVPDDQYLDWRYTRQWEKDWTEVFANYGNSHVVGTVAFQAFGLTDAEHLSTDNLSSQLGIAQAFVTLTPSLGAGMRAHWKVGSFWDKYGMSGKYDAGKYDTYLFGRTHAMGQTFSGEYDLRDFTLRVAEGLGVKDEELQFTALSPPFPGFTLLSHVHAGLSYKQIIDFNAHYLVAWAQDARVTTGADAAVPDGKEAVAGVEARVTGGIAGELYVGYAHISAAHVQEVGPALEVISSLGGYGQAGSGASGAYYGPNGLMDNYLGTCPKCTAAQEGTGSIDTLLVQYDYSFGLLWRRLQNPNAGFWGDGPDLTLNVFGMYTAVSSTDTSRINPLVGDGVRKLKLGADLVFSPLPWMGIGVRTDVVQPTNFDSQQTFSVISPKIIFRSRFLAHEEITAQYTHYFYGSDVVPQPPYGTAPTTAGAPFTGYPPDKNVAGIKATMWW